MRPIDRSDATPLRPTRARARKAEGQAGPQDEVQLSRTRNADGRFRVKRGDTKLKSLRETYGLDFAAGLPGNMPLAVLRAASGMSLSQMLKSPEKTEEAAERVGKEKHLVHLYEDGPGAGGGYPPVAQVDGPGAGGGYPPYQSVPPEENPDSPGAGGGYPPEDGQGLIDSPGAGGGYPPEEQGIDSPGAGGGYPPYQSVPPEQEGVDGPGAGGGYPPYQSVPPEPKPPAPPEKKD